MAESFADFIARERERLHAEREALFSEQHELDSKLAGINAELSAIDAYEAAKTGKLPAVRQIGRVYHANGRLPRGAKREQLLTVIGNHPAGLSRAELLELMGLKGNKAGEMSVSNALTALTKTNQVVRDGGKYRMPAA